MNPGEIIAKVETLSPASAGEFELNERETRKIRGLLYKLNKQGNRCFRTLRQGHLLMVWRIK